MRLYQILNEGLISSFPPEKVISLFANKGIIAQEKGERITLPYKIKDKVDNILNTIGWYIAYMDNSEIIIEPKYSALANDIPETLYHATEKENVLKIMKIGLVPKSKNRMSNHPDRIYAAISPGIAMAFFKHFIYGLYSPVMLTINTKKSNNVWHNDPNLKGGLYTTTNVPPIALVKET